MKIPYEQLSRRDALTLYCDWIVEQLKSFKPPFEWYYLFYPIRTLILGAKLLGKEEYAEAVWPWLDQYTVEQFPNGALSSTCRGKAITEYTVDEIEDYIPDEPNDAELGFFGRFSKALKSLFKNVNK